MKKMLVLLLVVSIMLGMTACGSPDQGQTEGADQGRMGILWRRKRRLRFLLRRKLP